MRLLIGPKQRPQTLHIKLAFNQLPLPRLLNRKHRPGRHAIGGMFQRPMVQRQTLRAHARVGSKQNVPRQTLLFKRTPRNAGRPLPLPGARIFNLSNACTNETSRILFSGLGENIPPGPPKPGDPGPIVGVGTCVDTELGIPISQPASRTFSDSETPGSASASSAMAGTTIAPEFISPGRRSEDRSPQARAHVHSRSDVIAAWIRIGELCRVAGDECSWRAILNALCSRPGARLDKVWKSVVLQALDLLEAWVHPAEGEGKTLQVGEPRSTPWGGDVKVKLKKKLDIRLASRPPRRRWGWQRRYSRSRR